MIDIPLNMSTVLIALLMAVLVLFSAYFSCSETAYTSMNSIRIKNLALEGQKNAEKALLNHENYEKLLATILVGNNIVNVAISTLGTMLFSELFGIAWGVIIATVFTATVILVFGEITPKTLGKRNADRYALKLAGSLHMVILILTPISWFFMKLTNLLSRGAKNDSAETPSFTEDELHLMIDEVMEEGALERSEGELVKSAMQLDEIKVSEMYTPRANITAVEMRTDAETLKKLFIESEYSRIPVYDGSLDRIIGIVYSKDFFFMYVEGREFTTEDIIRPVKFVPENTNIAVLLSDLQKSHIHIAIVLDSFGRTLGLVTMEDILEELVGDIWDERDEAGYPIHEEKDGSFTVMGEANIFDVMEKIGAEFNPGDFQDHSVSAFISHNMEGVPRRGDIVDAGGAKIVVRSMKSRRVKEARIFIVKKDVSSRKGQES
ncbi:MAG: hemolysin family protein [Candidatus Methanoplasma sp.]|jgi:CBS domain containing-hemolysin-like protein|nr:hemolysin family protein [Candidatus Methanoplasma sp.]